MGKAYHFLPQSRSIIGSNNNILVRFIDYLATLTGNFFLLHKKNSTSDDFVLEVGT